jgi:hypothetical protein
VTARAQDPGDRAMRALRLSVISAPHDSQPRAESVGDLPLRSSDIHRLDRIKIS